MIYVFRVILDWEKDDVFRDLHLEETASLEDLHVAIVNAFVLDGQQMASFYRSNDDWDQGEEFSLMPLEDGKNSVKGMSDWSLKEVIEQDRERFIYVYDFLDMWTFFVELMAIREPEIGELYPMLGEAVGKLPPSAPDKEWDAPNPGMGNDDIFDGDDSFSDFGMDGDDDYF
jgi:hypothetical protein